MRQETGCLFGLVRKSTVDRTPCPLSTVRCWGDGSVLSWCPLFPKGIRSGETRNYGDPSMNSYSGTWTSPARPPLSSLNSALRATKTNYLNQSTRKQYIPNRNRTEVRSLFSCPGIGNPDLRICWGNRSLRRTEGRTVHPPPLTIGGGKRVLVVLGSLSDSSLLE